ncbi:MAG TPA: GspE/PulE family protein [Rhodocyclaceae bacterium]
MNHPAAELHSLSPTLIEQARHRAIAEGRPLVEALQAESALSAAEYLAALGLLFAYPVLTMEQLHGLEPLFDVIGYAECGQRRVFAASGENGQGVVVLADPFDAQAEAWAVRRFPGARVFLAHGDDLTAYLVKQEDQLRAMRDIVGAEGEGGQGDAIEDISLARIEEDVSPVVKLVNSTIYDALKLQASDIHLECDASGLFVKYRIDGVLVQIGQVGGLELAEQVVSRVKVMAELDIAERRVPQDGRFKVRIGGREIDFRVSIMPNLFGEDAVLRLLDRQALTAQAQTLCLDDLGLDAEMMAAIRRLAAQPHGMLLVTGPTGSGKTTTLYAAITEINSGRDKIITIEDPVEYQLPRVLQIPVNEKKGLTFARGLRSILRHDPDKIMVGEIRDEDTAQIAVQAALTGHLVFTTVHANNAFDVLGRFMHMGVDPYSFAAALNGVVAQRLLRLNCPHCVEPYHPDDEELARAGLSRNATEAWRFQRGKGCGHCRGTGYRGRRAAAEVLVLNDHLREMVAARTAAARLKEEALRTGLRPLRQTVLAWVERGETTLAEVERVAG